MIDECHAMTQRQLAHFMIAIGIKRCKEKPRTCSRTARPGASSLPFETRINAVEGVGCFLVGGKGGKN